MNRTKNSLYPVVALLAVLFLVAAIQYEGWFKTSPAYAGSLDSLSGFAWSSNIGWISFNCTSDGSCPGGTGYGVNIDPTTGNFSGYAWSDSIGWISFNQTTGCPESGCTTQPNMNLSTGAVTGWAKALTANGSGWDGWIKLAGATPDGNVYGPVLSGGTFVGYSWGSDVIGWMSWSGVVSAPSITASLLVNGLTSVTIDSGQSATLSWSSTNATSCTTSGTWWPGGTPTSGSASTGVLTSTQSYQINCSGLSGGPVNSNLVTVTVNVPDINISANPTRVAQGGASAINWSASSVNNCNVAGPGLSSTALSGSQSVTVIEQQVYTITCYTSYNPTLPLSKSATVNIGSTTFQEF